MSFNIDSIKKKMLIKYPFFGSIVANVEYQEKQSIETAATDGQIIYYNKKFLESLSVDEQIFVFAHEICHIAFNHILRSEGKDCKTWNIATDAVINAFLEHDGLKMVKGAVQIEDAIHYKAEELYEKLIQEKNENGSSNKANQNQDDTEENNSNNQSNNYQNSTSSSSSQQSESSEQGNHQTGENSEEPDKNNPGNSNSSSDNSIEETNQENQDVGHDSHSMWEEAVRKHKEQTSSSDSQNQDASQSETQSELEKAIQEISEMDEKDVFKKNAEEKNHQLEELKKSLSKQVTKAGTSTNSNRITITDIGQSKPLIDWRYILREAIKYDVDWSYKNAMIEDGVLTPYLEEQPIPETEIILDTSGSINEALLRNFLRECKNILKQSRIKVGCFDTKFYGFHEIRTEQDIENMPFVGGGGTNFNVATRAFSKRVENKIIFTDGYADMPDEPIDAIWIVFGGITIKPKGGKVINISEEQLQQLSSLQEYETLKVKKR